jgi:hypothetical protein
MVAQGGIKENIEKRLENILQSGEEDEFEKKLETRQVRYKIIREEMKKQRFRIIRAQNFHDGIKMKEFEEKVGYLRQADERFKAQMDLTLELDREIIKVYQDCCFDEEIVKKHGLEKIIELIQRRNTLEEEREPGEPYISPEAAANEIKEIYKELKNTYKKFGKKQENQASRYRQVKTAVLNNYGDLNQAADTLDFKPEEVKKIHNEWCRVDN